MGAITVRMLEEIARDELGAQPSTSVEIRERVNMAGEHLVSMYPWRWLEGRQLRLRTRPQIEVADGTWTEATRTLTKVGAFASYSLLSADTIQITAGTGATPGTYEIESKTSSDAIVLKTSIGAAANGQTNIDGTMRNDQIALAPDFDIQAITGYAMTNGLVGRMRFGTPQEMLDLRTWPNLGSTVGFWALLNYVRSLSGGQPSLRVELWPGTDSSEEQLVIFYRGGWIEPAGDTDALTIPGWTNLLFTELFKAVHMGFEEPEGGSVSARLTLLSRKGPDLMPLNEVFRNAVVRDAMLQPDYGYTENGWGTQVGEGITRYDVPPPLIAT